MLLIFFKTVTVALDPIPSFCLSYHFFIFIAKKSTWLGTINMDNSGQNQNFLNDELFNLVCISILKHNIPKLK